MKLQYLDQSSVSETIIFASNVDGFGMSTVGPPLTERQHRVLDFIAQYAKDHGFPPTYQELRLHMGYSSLNAVSEVLRALERKGYIRRLPGRSRSIILTNTPNQESTLTLSQKTDTIPIIGTANADNLLSALLRPGGWSVSIVAFSSLVGWNFLPHLPKAMICTTRASAEATFCLLCRQKNHRMDHSYFASHKQASSFCAVTADGQMVLLNFAQLTAALSPCSFSQTTNHSALLESSVVCCAGFSSATEL